MVNVSPLRRILSERRRLVRARRARRASHDRVVVLPRLPRRAAAGRLRAIRQRSDPRARLCLQGRDPREGRRPGRAHRGGPGRPGLQPARSGRARCRSSARCSPTGACARVSEATAGRPRHDTLGRHRRRRDPRDDRRPAAGSGRGRGRAVRTCARAGRPRRHGRRGRAARGPLLPRDPADRPPRDRARRRARPGRAFPVPSHEGRLLRRRPGVLDDLAARGHDLPAAAPPRARPPRGVRGAVPADEVSRPSSTTRRSRTGSAARAGRACSSKLWRPLLDSKFDGRYDGLPATYIWARTRRMGTTRDRSGREVLGWLQGGYQTLIDAVADRIRELGGEVHANAPVDRIVGAGGRAIGVAVGGQLRRFDQVLCTLAPPQARRVMSRRPGWRRRPATTAATSASSACSCARAAASAPTTTSTSPTAACRSRRWSRRRTWWIPSRSAATWSTSRSYVDPAHPLHDRPAAEVAAPSMLRPRADDLPRPARRGDPAFARPARADHRARPPAGRGEAAAGHVRRAGTGDGVDGARVPGDRQRPGSYRRRGPSVSSPASSSALPAQARAAA